MIFFQPILSQHGNYIGDRGKDLIVNATNRALLILDLLRGLVAVIFGNFGVPTLVRYLVGTMYPPMATPLVAEKLVLSVICLLIAGYAYHATKNKIIRALVAIFIFVPVILMLLSFFTVMKVPLPF